MSVNQDTASDWDNERANDGAHHEEPTQTDWAPADTLEKGYQRVPHSANTWFMPLEDDAHSGDDLGDGDIVDIGNVYIVDAEVDNPDNLGAPNGVFNNQCWKQSGRSNVELAHSDTFDYSSWTISVWFKLEPDYDASGNDASNEDWRFMVGKAGTSTFGTDNNEMPDFAIGMSPEDSNTMRPLFMVSDSGSTGMPTLFGNDLPSDEWHHFVGVFDSGDFWFYVDGNQVDSGNFAPSTTVQSGDPWFVGDDDSVITQRNSPGWYNNAMFMDVALSSSEVQQLHDVVSGNSEYWADVQFI